MSSIAFFSCSFTPLADILDELSERLELLSYGDYDLINDTIVKYGIQSDKLHKIMYGGTSVFNQFTLDKEIIVNMFKSIISEKLDTTEKFIFNGLLTSLIPSDITHVLKVLVVDSKKNRIQKAIESNLSKAEAKKSIKRHDISAYNWTDFLFRKEAYDNTLYDLVVPVSGKSYLDLSKEITSCYHTTSVLPTTDSYNAVKNMRLATDVERILLHSGHKAQVSANQGNIALTITDSGYGYKKLTEELTELAKQIRGVEDVSINKSEDFTYSIYRKQKFELPSKVLFVDDEKDFVQTISQRLINRNVGTYGVYNGEDALELITKDSPDVMVLDLKMPGLHGIEVLRRTKELAPEVEVIILTGHGTESDKKDCMELGAFAYMNKPVHIEALSECIRAANERVRSGEKAA